MRPALAPTVTAAYAEPVQSRVVIVGVLLATVVLGHTLRTAIGVAELSPQGVRAAVTELGPLGPMMFFGLVVFRQVLAIPAVLVLTTGGLCFGVALGTVLGAAGIIVSGAGKFWIARWLGREWARRQFGARFQALDERVDRLGAVVIGLSTAHPLGVLAPFHWAAGLSSLSFTGFATALVLGAPVRAFALSVLGASIADGPPAGFWLAVTGLTIVLLSPLVLPSVRQRFGLL